MRVVPNSTRYIFWLNFPTWKFEQYHEKPSLKWKEKKVEWTDIVLFLHLEAHVTCTLVWRVGDHHTTSFKNFCFWVDWNNTTWWSLEHTLIHMTAIFKCPCNPERENGIQTCTKRLVPDYDSQVLLSNRFCWVKNSSIISYGITFCLFPNSADLPMLN
jgi:hypothetical protein